MIAPQSDALESSWSGLELLATAVLLLHDDGTVAYANPAAENLFQLSRAKLAGQRPGALFADAQALDAAIDKASRSGAAYTEQELALAGAGNGVQHVSCTASPVGAGEIALVLELRHIDRELRIAREERISEQQHANRELMRSLAHEIKNPLGGIRGSAQLLERELDRAQLFEYTQVIIGEADRLQSLLDRLLAPHRMPAYRRINIHELLVRVKGVVQAEFTSIPITPDFDISLPELEADAEQLTQALLNVTRNAAQALAGTTADPRIRMRTRIARQVTIARRHHRLAVSIEIEDNGPGVPPALLDRIFYPLVSGREGGSGLGLSIAQTLVAQHGGTIGCESVPGRTVFTLLVPLERNGS